MPEPTTPPLCGAENPDYPGEYACTFPAGHPRVADPDDGDPDDGPTLYDHAAPASGAWWNMPEPAPDVVSATTGHAWPCPRFYVLASPSDPCRCRADTAPLTAAEHAAIVRRADADADDRFDRLTFKAGHVAGQRDVIARASDLPALARIIDPQTAEPVRSRVLAALAAAGLDGPAYMAERDADALARAAAVRAHLLDAR